MKKVTDLTGQRFGRLIVIRATPERNKKGNIVWECKCDCGNVTYVPTGSLKEGNTKSCGCLQREAASRVSATHRLSRTRLHRIWIYMRERCYRKTRDVYKYYGGRGITVCDEWKNDFIKFYTWSMNNGYDENLTLDRIDNNKGYSPDNCRWVSMKQQQRNKRDNHYVTIDGETKTIAEWSEISGLNYRTLLYRIELEWPVEHLFDPVYSHRHEKAAR